MPADVVAHLLLGDRERLVVDQVALREGDDRALHAEDVEDLQVLLGLRLPTLVGGHDEEYEPHGSDAGEHVADELLVAGDVDEPDLAPARQRRPGVAEVDREPAPLLLGEAVGVDAGERDDQRRLAVVDVTGRRDDAQFARHRSVLVHEVVAFHGVEDGAGDVGNLRVGDGPHVEQHVVVRRAAEHRRRARRAAVPRSEAGSRTAHPHAPGREGLTGERAAADHRVAAHDVRAFEVAPDRLGQRAGAFREGVDGSWIIRCTGISPCAPVA